MAVLTTQDVVLTGLTEALVAASVGGDSFDNNGQCVLVVENGSGAPITVTIEDPNTSTPKGAAQFNPDVPVVVAAGGKAYIGPFAPFRFNTPDGRVNVTYSAVNLLSVGVIRLRT